MSIGNFSRLTRRQALLRSSTVLAAPVLLSPWLSGCGGGDDDEAVLPPTVKLASVANFRDIGGADDAGAYRGRDGRKLRRGVFYRSNALTLSAADKQTLESLRIAAIYDMRTPTEIAKLPNVLPSGAVYRKVNVLGVESAAAPNVSSAAAMIAAIEVETATISVSPAYTAGLAEVLMRLALVDGPQIFHCTAGKDRTGWLAYLLHHMLGVSSDVAMADYLLSNEKLEATNKASYERLKTAYGQAYADTYWPALGVQQSFLMAGVNEAKRVYGSLDGYIADGLKLDSGTLERLRSKLLV